MTFDPLQLDAQLQRCAQELPEGYRIVIQVERDSGWVDLMDPNGDNIEYPCNNEYGLIEQVMDALEFSKSLV